MTRSFLFDFKGNALTNIHFVLFRVTIKLSYCSCRNKKMNFSLNTFLSSNLNVIITHWNCLSNDKTTSKDVRSSLGDPMCGCSVMKSSEEK